MRILHNPQREEALILKVTATLEKQREGIHASDLLSPRLAYFRKRFPVPLSPEEVGYFATGHGHHMFLVHLESGKKGESQEASFFSDEYGISYSPDIASTYTEFKTARYPQIQKTEKARLRDFVDYAKQCLIYAICMKQTRWHLVVLYIGLRKTGPDGKYVGGLKAPVPKCWTIVFTKEELENGKVWLKEEVARLTTALERKSHQKLPLCDEWRCIRWNPETRKKEPQCPYFTTKCKPAGRYEEWKEAQAERTSK